MTSGGGGDGNKYPSATWTTTSFSSALLSKSDMSVIVGMYIDLHLVLGYPYVWIYLPHLWSTANYKIA